MVSGSCLFSQVISAINLRSNEHRSHRLYEDYFWHLLESFRARRPMAGFDRHGEFQFKNKLFSLDSTTISLSMFPWAKYRHEKGGVKVHVLLDHSDYLPAFVHITDARTSDSIIAKAIQLPKGSIKAEEKEKYFYFVTNNTELPPETIAEIYKERWQIETFFKTIKQTLNIKTFIGTSENALMIQIWTAMIAIMVLKWLHWRSWADWSFSVMSAMLRLNLFTCRPLVEWLNNPDQAPPEAPPDRQMRLFEEAAR